MSDTDLKLLKRYTHDSAEDAFAEIVRRHVDLVHSAALRQVRSPQLAEEVAQSAFTDLERNAVKLIDSCKAESGLVRIFRATHELVKLENLWKYYWHLDWQPPATRPP